MSQPSEPQDFVPFAPVEMVVALARGHLTLRDVLGPTDDSVLAVAQYGHQALQDENFQSALLVFDGLAALDPDVAYFRLGLGLALRGLDRTDEAREQLAAAVQLDGEDVTAAVHLAELLLEAKETATACALLQAVQGRIDGEHPLAEAVRQLQEAAGP